MNLADMHIGAKECDIDKINKLIEFVKATPNLYISIGGDMLNHATTTSKSSVFEEEFHGNEQLFYLYGLLEPIRDRILYIRSGNHGKGRSLKHNAVVTEEILAKLLKVPYLQGISTCIINARKNTYVISAIHHGRKPDKLEWIGSDITYIEHVHQNLNEKRMVMTMNKFTKKWMCRPMYYIYAGTMLGYGGYGMESVYRALETGYPIVQLSGIPKKWSIYIWDNIDNFKRFNTSV